MKCKVLCGMLIYCYSKIAVPYALDITDYNDTSVYTTEIVAIHIAIHVCRRALLIQWTPVYEQQAQQKNTCKIQELNTS